MTHNSQQALAATMVGAVLGGLAGYLFFTDRGRMLRRQFEPAVDDIARELNNLRSTVHKVSAVATEGMTLFNDAMGDGREPVRRPKLHQTSPF